MVYVFCAIAGLVGAVIGWLLASARVRSELGARIEESERRANTAEGNAAALGATVSELRAQGEAARKQSADDFQKLRGALDAEREVRVRAETERQHTLLRLEEEKKLLDEAKSKLTDTFKALAGDTLGTNTKAFLTQADGVVKPLAESLKQLEANIQALEKSRAGAYASLGEQVKALATGQQLLQKETGNLVTALRAPQVRGRWGEITLKKVVELAGMSDHCDYQEQVTAHTEDGLIRPDMVVQLPAGRQIVVDAKVSLDAYMNALSAESEEKRQGFLADHAKQIRAHMNKLSDKEYFKQFTASPDFVVMFIPGEAFFAAAVDYDHALIEDAVAKHVMLTTPTTLIALLRAVAYGWRQDQVAKNAGEISELGKELYERMRTLAVHFTEVGKGLKRAHDSYNDTIGCLEGRVLPTVRKFKELGATAAEEIPAAKPLETGIRPLSAPELTEGEK